MMTGGLVSIAIGLSFLSTLMIGKFTFIPETPGYVTFGLIWFGFLCLFVGTALVIAYLFSNIRKDEIKVEEKNKEVKSQKDPLSSFNDWNFQLEFQKWLEGHQGVNAGQILNEIKSLLATHKPK